jgi:hypothetical protein
MKSLTQFSVAVVLIVLASHLCIAQITLHEHRSPDPNLASSNSLEDYSIASLSKSHLSADPPELVEKSDGPGFTREFLSVMWRAGDTIDPDTLPAKTKTEAETASGDGTVPDADPEANP